MEAPRLTILPFLFAWDPVATQLTLNVMLVPIGDPRDPLAAASAAAPVAPSFVGSSVVLAPHVSTDLTTVPTLADVPSGSPELVLVAPSGQIGIFTDLAAQFNIIEPQQAFERKPAFRLAKYLPKSYRQSHSFVAPKTPLAVIDDSYLCALRCPPQTPPTQTPISTDVSWGEVFAMLIRHPAMARAAGLLHTVSLNLGGAFPGGWMFFSLASSSPFAAQAAVDPNYLRLFGTRVPPLETTRSRPVFTAVSFPIAANAAAQAALGALDEVFDEAITFDDGFAKIVHARQPSTSELAADDGSGLPLLTDPGIQLCWDDEDVLIGMNRGIGDNPDGTLPPEAPSGVAGYRIDVRQTGETAWTSLCRISGSGASLGSVMLQALDAELLVEVHPTEVNQQFWLPAYYTRWEGGSLVAPSAETLRLRGVPPRTSPLSYTAVDADEVPLRYGTSYDFRVRLADPAGGGPDSTEMPETTGQAPVARLDMRRKIRPRGVELDSVGPNPVRPTRVVLRRPRLGFPAAVFTGHPGAVAALNAVIAANEASPIPDRQAVAVPDPDASLLRIDVFVEMPGFDQSGDNEGFRRLIRTYRAFPAITDLTVETSLELDLQWISAPRLSDQTWPDEPVPLATTGPIELPTARNLRIELRAVGRMDLSYFSDRSATLGEPVSLWEGTLRVAELESASVLGPIEPTTALTSVFLQSESVPNALTRVAPSQSRPSPLLVARLANALDLINDSGTLYALPGHRVVFSCNGLTHALAPDASSLAFTSSGELPRTWITALRLPIARDWSWIGLAKPGIEVTRSLTLIGKEDLEDAKLASVSIPHTVNIQASAGIPNRESLEVIIVDAFTPPLDQNGHPHEVALSYFVAVYLEAGGPAETVTVETRLPVATAPQVAPRLVSAGHAFAPYIHGPDYAETGDRTRRLWVEFAKDPRKDERDVLYGRILTVAPDPMLLPDYEPDPDPESLGDLDLDPELTRVIRPGQAEDFAGLSAMQPLIPSPDSPLHYAVPLPPSLGPGAPELFGFFTLEFRLGHPRSTASQPFWSTAQGRFGPPLVISGMQYPAPTLQVAVLRKTSGILASADYAQPVRDGRRVPLTRPNTEIWYILYTRIVQIDGTVRRNIPLLRRRARPRRVDRPGLRPLSGEAIWNMSEIEAALAAINFSGNTPFSILAIELLPEPNGAFVDPLGADLGEVRILRTSRLIEVPSKCYA